MTALRKWAGYGLLSLATFFPHKVEGNRGLSGTSAESSFTAAATMQEKKIDRAAFAVWVKKTRAEMIAKGIAADLAQRALPDDLAPVERAVQLDRNQPERVRSFAGYMEAVVSDRRVSGGIDRMRRHKAVLDKIGEEYGVDPQVIVALWGVETNFGATTGGFDIIPALATLAFDGRRATLFKGELFAALQIVQQGHVRLEDMKGSWAGGMGHNQFLPTSFLRLAVDYDKDGRKDIWGTLPDIFASSANYLKRAGWKYGQAWGQAIDLPRGIDRSLLKMDVKKPVSFWTNLGIKLDPSLKTSATASVIQPDGAGTQAYIVYDNYRVIMRWNNSRQFAAAVGTIADKVKKGAAAPAARNRLYP